MKTTSRPPVRSAVGNGEERAAQITRIQERLERISRVHNQIGTELAGVTSDVKDLNVAEPPRAAPVPEKASN
jgi:hypothetical protein